MSGPVKVGRTSSAEVRFSAELCPLVEGARAVSAATKDSVVRKIGIPPHPDELARFVLSAGLARSQQLSAVRLSSSVCLGRKHF
jgi:hypothetical protein